MKTSLVLLSLLVVTGLMAGCTSTEPPTQEAADIPATSPTEAPTATAEPVQELVPGHELVEYIDYKSNQKLDVYLPTGVEAPYPTVIGLKGMYGTHYDLQPLAIYLAERGHASVLVEPEYEGNKFAYDAACALAWVFTNADEYSLDLTRIAIFGESWGGMPASFLGTNQNLDPFLVDCDYTLPESYQIQGVVTWDGIFCAREGLCSKGKDTSEVASYWGVSESALSNMWELLNATPPQGWDDISGELNEEVQDWFSVLSLRHLDDSDPPFLFLVYSGNDEAELYMDDVHAIGGIADTVLIEGAGYRDHTIPTSPGFPLISEAIGTFLEDIFSD